MAGNKERLFVKGNEAIAMDSSSLFVVVQR